MSSIVISGNTSGSVTLSAPAVAGNTVLNLPTSSGTLSTGGVGEGQTWQDLTASRASATTYTNSTGKPIQVSFTAISGGAGDAQAALTVGGVLIQRLRGVPPNASFTDGGIVTAIVPNGTTYSITFSGATTAIWAELR